MIRKVQVQGLHYLKIKEFTLVNDCFQKVRNAEIGLFLQALTMMLFQNYAFSQDLITKSGFFILYKVESEISTDNFNKNSIIFYLGDKLEDIDSNGIDSLFKDSSYFHSDENKIYFDFISAANCLYYLKSSSSIIDSVLNDVNILNRDSVIKIIRKNSVYRTHYVVPNSDTLNILNVNRFNVEIIVFRSNALIIECNPNENSLGFNQFYWNKPNQIYLFKNISTKEKVSILLSLE